MDYKKTENVPTLPTTEVSDRSNSNTWDQRDPVTGRHHRNGHLLELSEGAWHCLICKHWFEAAIDADLFWCGESCLGKHPGEANGPIRHRL